MSSVYNAYFGHVESRWPVTVGSINAIIDKDLSPYIIRLRHLPAPSTRACQNHYTAHGYTQQDEFAKPKSKYNFI